MEKLLETDGVRLCIREVGDPHHPTVVLVHGYPDTQAIWDGVVTELSGRFHVVTYDVRGAGASTAPRDTRGYALGALVGDLLAVVDHVSPDRPVHLVGHDWGSIQSWEAVTDERFRSRIASFTSISGPSLDHVGHWLRSRLRAGQLWAVARQALRSWYMGALHLPLVPALVWRLLARRWPISPARTLASDGRRGAGLYRANLSRRLLRPRPRPTSVPVQLITPTNDPFVERTLNDGLELWAPTLWRREVWAEHWVQRSHPQWVAKAVTELVEHVEGASPSVALRRARSAPKPRTKLVLVTGGGSGIGRATALAFAEQGAEVVIADLDLERASRTAKLARLLGVDAHAVEVDVASAKGMERFAAFVCETWGVPDVVINNAGVGVAGSFLDTSVEEWARILGVNLWGVIHGSRLFGERMVEHGAPGHIVNVASAAAYMPSRAMSAYATTKASVLMLTQCLRAELGDRGIGVTAVCPGVVDTGIVQATRFVGLGASAQAAIRTRAKRLYRRRRFTPERVADAIVAGVLANDAVLLVTAEAKVGHLLSRLSPALMRLLARRADLPKVPRPHPFRSPTITTTGELHAH